MSQVRTFPTMGISKLGLRSRTITGNRPQVIQKRVSFIFSDTDSETGSEPEVDVFSISPRLMSPDFINSISTSTFVAHDNRMMHDKGLEYNSPEKFLARFLCFWPTLPDIRRTPWWFIIFEKLFNYKLF